MDLILEGKSISLIPLEEKYLDELLAFSADPVIWMYLPALITNKEDLMLWYNRTKADAANGNVFPFFIQNNFTREILGSTRIFDYDASNKRAEIGMSWINPTYFGTKVNLEAKFLLLRYAFNRLTLNRVQFKVDELNIRSQKAVLKLGAKQEGVLRNFKIRNDGTKGDSFLYSIISTEWPEVEKQLNERLQQI